MFFHFLFADPLFSYWPCQKEHLNSVDERHLNLIIASLRSQKDILNNQIHELEKMKICGNKANAKIKFGLRNNLTSNEVRFKTEEWFCKDHIFIERGVVWI